MKITNRIVYLLRGHIADTLSIEERAELQAWANRQPAYRRLLDEVNDEASLTRSLAEFDAVYGEDEAMSLRRMRRRMFKGIANENRQIRKVNNNVIEWLSYAAALIVAVSIGISVYTGQRITHDSIHVDAADISPGGNRATLTLADGRTVNLKSTQTGIVMEDGIRYVDGTEIAAVGHDAGASHILSLSTPKGGTYQIVLPDGTKVWLNSASVLRYPSQFSDSERIVELEGEAYFEVARNASIPFLVHTKSQTVEVLGTQFNISAYGDEGGTQTTLVAGKVQVAMRNTRHSVLLAPGEQSVLNGDTFIKRSVNVAAYIGWKNGVFYFDETPLQSAMTQLSRWYDVEVVYKHNDAPESHFYGEIDKNKPLSEVLDILQEGGVKFEVVKEGARNKLIVHSQIPM